MFRSICVWHTKHFQFQLLEATRKYKVLPSNALSYWEKKLLPEYPSLACHWAKQILHTVRQK